MWWYKKQDMKMHSAGNDKYLKLDFSSTLNVILIQELFLLNMLSWPTRYRISSKWVVESKQNLIWLMVWPLTWLANGMGIGHDDDQGWNFISSFPFKLIFVFLRFGFLFSQTYKVLLKKSWCRIFLLKNLSNEKIIFYYILKEI